MGATWVPWMRSVELRRLLAVGVPLPTPLIRLTGQWCLERVTCGRARPPPYCCAVLLSRLIRRSGGDSILACISHQPSAAADDAQSSAGFSHFGVLDVPSSTTPRPSGRKPRRAMHLADLATEAGEICRPGISSKAPSTRYRYREARLSHRCSSRGRRGAVRSGVYDPRGADSYLTVRGAPRGEKTPLSAVHRRPQQKTGEIGGLVHDQDTCLDVVPEKEG